MVAVLLLAVSFSSLAESGTWRPTYVVADDGGPCVTDGDRSPPVLDLALLQRPFGAVAHHMADPHRSLGRDRHGAPDAAEADPVVVAAVGPAALEAHRAARNGRLLVRVVVQTHVSPEPVAPHLHAAPHLRCLNLALVDEAGFEFWLGEKQNRSCCCC